jgi:oxygen-independent coproporphyrinogen-3 oxidase
MTLIIDGHPFHYGMENLCRVFYPFEKIRVVSDSACEDDPLVYTGLSGEAGGTRVTVRLKTGGTVREETDFLAAGSSGKAAERRMAVLLFELLSRECGIRPQWGVLTGVRPVKLFGSLCDGLGEEGALERFRRDLLVSPQKAELSRITLRNERKILAFSRPESFSLYISIPFCPTRCSYCSFVSSSVEKTFRLIPEYVRLLCREIEKTGEIAASLKLRLESVYVGGGTPTTLSAEQLGAVLDAVRGAFDLSVCREVTVEAGRPDTVTVDRLAAMRTRGVTRISINPQTLSDRVLQAIGRRHTTEQTLSAFALARGHGFENINMDLIAGLPEDDFTGFCNTLKGVAELAPESVTVHTLALKRAARLSKDPAGPYGGDPGETAGMIDFADGFLLENGYAPYYLYRQSRMVGNLENTGWSKPGRECAYNVFIMEECHSILACGAGAVTKLKGPGSGRLERVFNFKYPYEYISRYEEMLRRKDRVMEFYDGCTG